MEIPPCLNAGLGQAATSRELDRASRPEELYPSSGERNSLTDKEFVVEAWCNLDD